MKQLNNVQLMIIGLMTSLQLMADTQMRNSMRKLEDYCNVLARYKINLIKYKFY